MRLQNACHTIVRRLPARSIATALPGAVILLLLHNGAIWSTAKGLCLLEKDADLNKFLIERLSEGWTPEQISGWLKEGNEKGLCAIAFETIYRFIYRASQKTQKLWKYLIRHHHKRKEQCARASCDRAKERQSIHDRPEYVNNRSTFGHCDLFICKRSHLGRYP